MAANMYRVGDYVYFETSSSEPYQIRRVEELNKTPNGNVEAKVRCFYRRRDIPATLVKQADRSYSAWEDEVLATETSAEPRSEPTAAPATASDKDASDVTKTSTTGASSSECQSESAVAATKGDGEDQQARRRQRMEHREVFLSRQVEALPATQIRGKCSVTLLCEAEVADSYLSRKDCFFYALVYDPMQKSLRADEGEMRVGGAYQADVPVSHDSLLSPGDDDGRRLQDLETLVWKPHHGLEDAHIDRVIMVAKSVGTFARALDCCSSIKQPSLHMSAAAASRDITLFHAMDVLHKNDYDLTAAVSSLVPASGPVLCRDEMEHWSVFESNLFEEALDKCGKDFELIRQGFLPWKTHCSLIEYYYMWKATDRCVQRKRVKAAEAESQLKQVYIPNYSGGKYDSSSSMQMNNGTLMSNGSSGGGNRGPADGRSPCAGCGEAQSQRWYSWSPTASQQSGGSRLCAACWDYWKRYGSAPVDGVPAVGGASAGEDLSTQSQPAQQQVQRCTVAGCGRQFRLRAQLIQHAAAAHRLLLPGTGSSRPVTRIRAGFQLLPTWLARVARRLCLPRARLRRAARAPALQLNVTAVRDQCARLVAERSKQDLRAVAMKRCRTKERPNLLSVSKRLLGVQLEHPVWLVPAEGGAMQPARVAFPRPPKAPDGSIIYTPVEEKIQLSSSVTLTRKRPPANGLESGFSFGGGGAPISKRPRDSLSITPIMSPANSARSTPTSALAPLKLSAARPGPPSGSGRRNKPFVARQGSTATVSIVNNATGDGIMFVVNAQLKRLREGCTPAQLHRIARRPCRIEAAAFIKPSVPARPM